MWKQALRTAVMLTALYIFVRIGLNWALAMEVGFNIGKLACVQ